MLWVRELEWRWLAWVCWVRGSNTFPLGGALVCDVGHLLITIPVDVALCPVRDWKCAAARHRQWISGFHLGCMSLDRWMLSSAAMCTTSGRNFLETIGIMCDEGLRLMIDGGGRYTCFWGLGVFFTR